MERESLMQRHKMTMRREHPLIYTRSGLTIVVLSPSLEKINSTQIVLVYCDYRH